MLGRKLKNVKNAFFIPKIKKNVCNRDKKTLPSFLHAFDVGPTD